MIFRGHTPIVKPCIVSACIICSGQPHKCIYIYIYIYMYTCIHICIYVYMGVFVYSVGESWLVDLGMKRRYETGV
jgi:hypothetical protein